MKVAVARLVSIVGHPFALLLLSTWLLRAPDGTPGSYRLLLAALAIVVVPLSLLTWYARASGRWQTVDASAKADRPLLYLCLALILLALAAYFRFVERSATLLRGCVVFSGMMSVAFLVNPYLKLSLHVAFAAFCGLLLADIRLADGLPILACLPLLMWSRLALRRHTFAETVAGLALGIGGAGCLLWLQHHVRV